MIRKNPRGDLPQIHPSAFVDPTAILCGKVIVEENVFIGPYAVIRADEMDAIFHGPGVQAADPRRATTSPGAAR